MEGSYNLRNPAVKRLMREAHELREATEQFSAHPLEDNLFEWHFTIRGPDDTDFAGGFYHGRILLPPEYPMKPPSIILLTPSGRFETNKKICLSISGYHPETWLPSWSLRTALLGIIGFMPSHGGGAIGSLEYTPEERKSLARKSQDWKCPHCGLIKDLVLPITKLSQELKKEAQEIGQQIKLTGEKKAKEQDDASESKEKDNGDATTEAKTSSISNENTNLTESNLISTSAPLNNQNVFNYQFPPFNMNQQFPITFPPFPLHNADQTQTQQTHNQNVIPPQFMWQLPQNYFPYGIHQSMPSHLPTFSTVSTTTSLPTIIPSLSVGITSTTTPVTSTAILNTNAPIHNTTDNIQTTSTAPLNEHVVSSSIITSSSSIISTDIKLPASSPSSTQSSTPTTTELRQRLKTSVNTTDGINSSVSNSQTALTTTVTSLTNQQSTSSSPPRIIQTNSSAEIRRNFRGSSGFFDMSIDLLIIILFFAIFVLIFKRVMSFF